MSIPDEKELVLWAAKELANEGADILRSDPRLTAEALGCVDALVADRPPEVLEDPNCDKITMLAGIALGIALQKSSELIEALGGFGQVIERLGGEDAILGTARQDITGQ